jgi:hypothetical protein
VIDVAAGGLDGAVAPKLTSGIVAPRPATYTTIISPVTAGSLPVMEEPLDWWTMRITCGKELHHLMVNPGFAILHEPYRLDKPRRRVRIQENA